jgi:hypothetical protein
MLGACQTGYDNCDRVADNGCEAELTSSAMTCGNCLNVCGMGTYCADRTCHACGGTGITCGTACVNRNTDPANCGACGTVCQARPNARPTCAMASCGVACTPGFGNCDSTIENGCETDLNTSAAHCGACGRTCPITNGTGACTAGLCTVGSCNPGWGDCDRDPSNGCEAPLNTPANCGGCGRACVLPNATSTCMGGPTGTCALISCNAGFSNCDREPSNGCEVNTAYDAANCSTCGNRCTATVPNGHPACLGGTCGTACNIGYGDCNGSGVDGCETNLMSSSNCGACGRICARGTVCSCTRFCQCV